VLCSAEKTQGFEYSLLNVSIFFISEVVYMKLLKTASDQFA